MLALNPISQNQAVRQGVSLRVQSIQFKSLIDKLAQERIVKSIFISESHSSLRHLEKDNGKEYASKRQCLAYSVTKRNLV
jgi:hypothetical protein